MAEDTITNTFPVNLKDYDISGIVKQLIVVNMAVPMSYGQISAQISHCSMLGILNQGRWINNKFEVECDTELKLWLSEHFTIVILKTWGKDSILKLKAEAEALYLNTAVMEDYGFTTALAIGPALDSKLAPFKRLTLL